MGPLAGLRVVELGGIGPVQHAAIVLADHGAEVVRIVRPASDGPADMGGYGEALEGGRKRLTADLGSAGHREQVLRLIAEADVAIEGFRPGVAERLGVGPQTCCTLNPRLVYGRVSGWGQDGPLASSAGHDINFLALSGILDNIGTSTSGPVPPLGVLGDFGAGSMPLLFGIMAALWERQSSGLGQVVEASILDGAGVLADEYWTWFAEGKWAPGRGENFVDGCAPFYSVYECSDRRFVAVGALEPKFYSRLVAGLGLVESELAEQWDRAAWATTKEAFSAEFKRRPRDEWAAYFLGLDACVSPVLSFEEVPRHPHVVARASFDEQRGGQRPRPAPFLSRTPAKGVSRAVQSPTDGGDRTPMWDSDPDNYGT